MSWNRESQVSPAEPSRIIYDQGTIKIVAFACFIIVLAVIMTGTISYFITRNAVVDKLKSRDMIYIVESISAKIDGRIERAKETSLIFAKDPTIIQWIASGETDEKLGANAKEKLTSIAQNYDYANAFVVSAMTNHYWAEGSQLIQIMSAKNPNDKWFYEALKSGKSIELNIDYNSGRNDTFVFLNTLVGDLENPIAVAGVGLSLEEIAKEFRSYKFGQRSNLWLVDNQGKIHLSDDATYNGKQISDFLPSDVASQIVGDIDSEGNKPKVVEYTGLHGEIFDLAYQSTKSTDWKLVFQIPRNESIAFLSNIKLNAAIASLIALLLMVFIFYIISRRIANPFKRSLVITQEMENQVRIRTHELAEKNQKIMDSIDYAKRLQESILPSEDEFSETCREHFVLWRPRDVVGGDFYWVRRIDLERSLIAIIDCTGHGVPGAFMTMAVNSILNQIVDIDNKCENVGEILAELNRRVKETLHRNDQNQLADDGLDIAICYVEGNKRLTFAGAKISLYVKRGNQVHVIKGDNQSIGYRRSSQNLEAASHSWEIETGDTFYLTTDGYIDQNGGERDYPLGKKKFIQFIADQSFKPLEEQQESFAMFLENYMGNEPQRDDITVIGISF
jgi:serine phosphatase RsbU (regulator of sigma subunit)